MKYKLCWWEENGYHDSYFYGVYWDDEAKDLRQASLGATAFAGGIGFDVDYLMPTPEIVEQARQALSGIIFRTIKDAEFRDIHTPGPNHVQQGRAFRLRDDHSFYMKSNGEFAKDRNGKRIRIQIPAGAVVTARRNGAEFFGTRFSKGYNQPHRGNTSVSIAWPTPVGMQFVLLPMDKLRQDAEPMSDEALKARAEELSFNLQFAPAFGCKAWTCDDWAGKVGLPVKQAV